MERVLRRRHFRTWVLLAPVLIVGTIVLLTLRPDRTLLGDIEQPSPDPVAPGGSP